MLLSAAAGSSPLSSGIGGNAANAAGSALIPTLVRALAGVAGFLVAAVTGVRTALRLDEQAAKQRISGLQYGARRTEMEVLIPEVEEGGGTNDVHRKKLGELLLKSREETKEAPSVPQRFYDQATADLPTLEPGSEKCGRL